jgi:hypothetical protein
MKPSDDQSQRAGDKQLLPEDDEIIELIDKVPDSAGLGKGARASAAGSPESEPDQPIELTDRVYLSASGVPMAQAPTPEPSVGQRLLDTLDLDEALRAFGQRQADAGERTGDDDHLGFTTTLEDLTEVDDEDIIDLDALEDPTLKVEQPQRLPTDSVLADDLLDELDNVLLEDDLSGEKLVGRVAEPDEGLGRTAAAALDRSLDALLPEDDEQAGSIDLDDVLSTDLAGLDDEGPADDLLQGFDLDEGPFAVVPAGSGDEKLDLLGLAAPPAAGLAAAMASPGARTAEEMPAPSQVQLQQALVRAIKEVYAERIESLLLETIEKVVSQEIRRLKSLLLEEQGQRGRE